MAKRVLERRALRILDVGERAPAGRVLLADRDRRHGRTVSRVVQLIREQDGVDVGVDVVRVDDVRRAGLDAHQLGVRADHGRGVARGIDQHALLGQVGLGLGRAQTVQRTLRRHRQRPPRGAQACLQMGRLRRHARDVVEDAGHRPGASGNIELGAVIADRHRVSGEDGAFDKVGDAGVRNLAQEGIALPRRGEHLGLAGGRHEFVALVAADEEVSLPRMVEVREVEEEGELLPSGPRCRLVVITAGAACEQRRQAEGEPGGEAAAEEVAPRPIAGRGEGAALGQRLHERVATEPQRRRQGNAAHGKAFVKTPARVFTSSGRAWRRCSAGWRGRPCRSSQH